MLETPKGAQHKKSMFRQEITPSAIKRSIQKSTTPNDKQNYGSNVHGYHSRKKSGAQLSTQRNRKKRGESPVSETASEKAVKDAMMKTTQKIYFPKAFQLPGQKPTKKEK